MTKLKNKQLWTRITQQVEKVRVAREDKVLVDRNNAMMKQHNRDVKIHNETSDIKLDSLSLLYKVAKETESVLEKESANIVILKNRNLDTWLKLLNRLPEGNKDIVMRIVWWDFQVPGLLELLNFKIPEGSYNKDELIANLFTCGYSGMRAFERLRGDV